MTTLTTGPLERMPGVRQVVVKTAYGAVRSRVADGVSTFLGIPFAAPPFGLGVQAVAIGGAAEAPSTMSLLGRCAEGLAAGAFVLHAWPRVKLFGTDQQGVQRVRRDG